jgi:hypothetical protein
MCARFHGTSSRIFPPRPRTPPTLPPSITSPPLLTRPSPRSLHLPLRLVAQKEEREARDAEQLAKAKKLTARQAFVGGVTGLGIAFVLYGLTQQIVGAMDGKAVPENYQARQISITVRTIVSGLAYLATFVYAANGTGLVALAAQKWLDKLTGADLIDEAAARWERNEIDGEEEKKE